MVEWVVLAEWALFAISVVAISVIIVAKGRRRSTWFWVVLLTAATVGWKFFLKPYVDSTYDVLWAGNLVMLFCFIHALGAWMRPGGRIFSRSEEKRSPSS